MKKKYLHIAMLIALTTSSFLGLGKHVKHNVKNEFNNKNVTLNIKNNFKDIVRVAKYKHNSNFYKNNKARSVVKNGTDQSDIIDLSSSENKALIGCIGGLALFGAIIGLVVGGCFGIDIHLNLKDVEGSTLSARQLFRSISIVKGPLDSGTLSSCIPIARDVLTSTSLTFIGSLLGAGIGFIVPYSIMIAINADAVN